MHLRAVLANVLRAEPIKRPLGPLSIGAGLIADGLQLGNAVLQHVVGVIGDAVLDRVVDASASPRCWLFWPSGRRGEVFVGPLDLLCSPTEPGILGVRSLNKVAEVGSIRLRLETGIKNVSWNTRLRVGQPASRTTYQ